MKLRLVKNFTSRENEIERKEEGRLPSHALPPPSQAAASARAPLRSRSPPPFIFPLSLPLLFSASKCPLRRPSLSAATCRHMSLQPSLPSCSASPFLLHKITEAARYGIRRVALYSTCRPSLPVQLADCGAQLAAPLLLHQIRCRDSSPVLMASSLWRMEP